MNVEGYTLADNVGQNVSHLQKLNILSGIDWTING